MKIFASIKEVVELWFRKDTYDIKLIPNDDIASYGQASTIKLPEEDTASTTIVSKTSTDILTNKTLDAATIGGAANDGTDGFVLLKDQSGDPANPGGDDVRFFAKDKKLYQVDSTGLVKEVGTGTGSDGINHIDNPDFEDTIDGAVPTGWHNYLDRLGVTFTDAGDLVGLVSHGFKTGDLLSFTTITTTTGIVIDTSYYAIIDDADNFQVASSYDLAVAGTALPLTTDGTGLIVWATPFDGGAVDGSITILGNNTDPLRGSISAVITKDAANRMGQGISYIAIDIDDADLSSVIAVSFDYSVTANFEYGTNGVVYDPSDVTVWVYDKTNSNLIQLAPYTLDGRGDFYGTFQAASDSNSYQLLLHVSTVNAATWDFKVDNVRVGPQTTISGPAMSDSEDYIPALSWTSNIGVNSARHWRVGERGFVSGTIVMSGAADAADLTIALPPGWVIDTDKVEPSDDNAAQLGSASYADAGARATDGVRIVYSSTSVVKITINDANFAQASPIVWANTDEIWYEFSVPVVGWSSNTLVSHDADTRVVAGSFYRNANWDAVDATWEVMTWDTTIADTHNAYSVKTYTIPVSGWYDISAKLKLDSTVYLAGQGFIVGVAINSTSEAAAPDYNLGAEITNNAGETKSMDVNGSIKLPLNAGDTIQIKTRANYNAGSPVTVTQNGATRTNFSIAKISGPAQIAASEVVVARAFGHTSGGVSGITDTYVKFDTTDYDTHGGFTHDAEGAVGAGAVGTRYTTPIAGFYQVDVLILMTSVSFVANDSVSVIFHVNGSAVGRKQYYIEANRNGNLQLPNTDTYQLNAGDYMQVEVDSSDTHLEISSTGNENTRLIIKRIGGVM